MKSYIRYKDLKVVIVVVFFTNCQHTKIWVVQH